MKFRISTSFIFLSLWCLLNLCMSQEAPAAPNTEQVQEAIKSHLPAAPEGFAWQLYKNAVFLKPAQWHERVTATKPGGIPVFVYAASPEEFSDIKQFEMGLTLQIISGSQHVRNIEARKMALLYLKPILDAHKKEEVLMLEQSTRGDFERTFFRYRDAPAGLKPIIVHKFILANNVTDSVHIFTFESPADTWEGNWAKYGTPILGKVNVIPTLSPN